VRASHVWARPAAPRKHGQAEPAVTCGKEHRCCAQHGRPAPRVSGRAARPGARASFSTVTSLRYTPAQPAMYARRLRSMSSTVVRLFQPPAARMALARHTPARAPQLKAAQQHIHSNSRLMRM